VLVGLEAESERTAARWRPNEHAMTADHQHTTRLCELHRGRSGVVLSARVSSADSSSH